MPSYILNGIIYNKQSIKLFLFDCLKNMLVLAKINQNCITTVGKGKQTICSVVEMERFT